MPDPASAAPKGRFEDHRLLRGEGRFVGDCAAGALHAVFLRAEAAEVTLRRLDARAARAMPGVVLVATAADLAADGVAPFAPERLRRDDGAEPPLIGMPVLCDGAVRHVGEPLALIVADSEAAALDAAEAVEVDLEPAEAVEGIAFLRRFGDAAAVAEALARAAHKVTVEVAVPRVHAVALEPRAVLAEPGEAALTLRLSTQNPFATARGVARQLGLAPEAVRALTGDVGGSFGLKGFATREDVAVAWAARRIGRPVLWQERRAEAFVADSHGRGATGAVTLGLDGDGRFLALEGSFTVDAGAYPTGKAMGLCNNIGGLAGLYAFEALAAEVVGRLSPRVPLAPYRGAGRPEATHAVETAIDAAARRLGFDPAALRLQNLVPPERMPYRTGLTLTYDCGDFPGLMRRALAVADYAGAPARRREAEARGRLHGVGVIGCIETAGGVPTAPRPDCARVTVRADGAVSLRPGAISAGQGHETGLRLLLAGRLEIAPEGIDYAQGDTAEVPDGRGMGGSSALAVCGPAVAEAARRLIADGRGHVARTFGAAPEDVAYEAGVFRVGTGNERQTLAEVAARLGGDGGWSAEAVFQPEASTYPNGTHVAEVEIDPETGAVALVRYSAVEDVGTVLNPVMVEGQMHGGIVQGAAQALAERMVHAEDGQVLTGSFMDYAVPRAADMPFFTLETRGVPTAVNPLGVKGVGEAGTVGALAAVTAAVRDALARAGVEAFEMPATPARVWEALDRARRGG